MQTRAQQIDELTALSDIANHLNEAAISIIVLVRIRLQGIKESPLPKSIEDVDSNLDPLLNPMEWINSTLIPMRDMFQKDMEDKAKEYGIEI